ncbi:hypothetical protein ACFWAY_52220 [Rhodococcus sp. NPDC059968]|uniref:hypothetical protein n=1 Tax=Rhodococcus sp. NPDC059968 TaxID=3347017 RepID=UPI00366D0DA5
MPAPKTSSTCTVISAKQADEALTHELTHREQGTRCQPPGEPIEAERRKLTTRRTIDELVDEPLSTQAMAANETADKLWSNANTLGVHIQTLTEIEREDLNEEVTRRQPR